jgi:HlyD family secretion protein
LGDQALIVLDAAPNIAIPASISYVSSTAQFTPKTVETQTERQKLMFRIKTQIAPELLKKHLDVVKTGIPGVTWLKLDQNLQWPDKIKKLKVAE